MDRDRGDGKSMAGHVQAGGHELFVHNRTKAKAEELLKKGATWCDAPIEVAERSEVLFSIVGLPSDVEETYLGKKGVLSGKGPCRIIVDMTTSRPSLAETIAQEAAKKGVESLDAPVSGGDIGAREATLAIMWAARKRFLIESSPVPVDGEEHRLYGQSRGRAACEDGEPNSRCRNHDRGLRVPPVRVKLGLDQQAVIDIISKGAAGSWAISNLGPRLVRGDFKTGFFCEALCERHGHRSAGGRRCWAFPPRARFGSPALHSGPGSGPS